MYPHAQGKATHASDDSGIVLDAFLMAQPATLDGKHVFVGSNAQVLSVPQYRIAGLYSMSNAEVVTPALTVPNNGGSDAGAGYGHPIALNANATWAGRLVTGGCDEGFDVLSFPPFSFSHLSERLALPFQSYLVIWIFSALLLQRGKI